LWQWIKKEVEASNLPELKKGILSAEPMLKAQGIELEQLLDSLSGRMGMVMALDAENTSRIPLGQIPVDLPNPDMALIFSAENSYLFDLLQKMMPFAQKSEEKDVKKLIIPLPPTLPIPLKPVIWLKDNLLFVASNEEFVKSILSARKKGDGLIKTEEFKALSLHMPKKGNSFRFISARLVDLFLDIQQKAMQASAMGKEEDKIAREIFDLFPKNLALYGITRNSDEGLVFTVNTNLSFEYIALLPATAAVGIAAAVAIPNILTAKQKGGQKATMSDLKMISMAIETYMIDKGYPPQGNTLGEIRAQLEPFYIKKLPLKDAWGNDFLYRYISQDGKHVYYIGSGGRDGVFEGFEQSGFYMVTGVNDFNKDIIIKNGEFTLGPQVK
ncbi:MAG: type II secretion system protein GspG, partial [Candidatus Aminicenantes bacterium]|nr:type II secretion system protein GspG [Candidatus Aminicenantes bacterium]